METVLNQTISNSDSVTNGTVSLYAERAMGVSRLGCITPYFYRQVAVTGASNNSDVLITVTARHSAQSAVVVRVFDSIATAKTASVGIDFITS